MSTHLRICCPSCQRTLKARPEHLNKRVVCNHCKKPFVARPEAEEPLFSPPRFAISPAGAEAGETVITSALVGAGQASAAGPAPRAETAQRARVEPLEPRL